MQGWIKLHRQLLEWEWIQDGNVFCIFIYCLLRANHKEKRWRGNQIERGSFITSYKHISEALSVRHSKISVQQVRTALAKLKLTGEITIKTTNKYTLVKVNNWDKYQADNTRDNTWITGKQQTNNKQITTNKNDKNDKNEKKSSRFTPPSLSDVSEYITQQGYTVDPNNWYDFYSSKGWLIGKNKMKDWKAAVRTWARRENKVQDVDPVKEVEHKKYEEDFYQEHGYYPMR